MGCTRGESQQTRIEVLNVIRVETKDRLAAQFDQVNAIDTKAGVLMGFAGVMMTWAASARVGVWPVVIMFVPLTANLLAFVVGKYRRDPNPEILIRKYRYATPVRLSEQLVANWNDCFRENKTLVRRKLLFLKAGYVTFAFAAGVSAIGLMFWWR